MHPPDHGKPIEILLVEDNPADVRMTREALTEAGVWHRLYVVEDGIDAVAFLRQRGRFFAAPRPDVVLLDLNLPKKAGHEVLAEIKADKALEQIPVVVLTSSRAQRDVTLSHDLNADCFITKPSGLDAFVREMRFISELCRQRDP